MSAREDGSTDPGALSPDMRALLDAVAAETGPVPDGTLLPPAEGRALAAQTNARWNRDLPAMASVMEARVPADPTLGSAEVPLLVLTPPDAGAGTILYVHGGGFAFCSPQTHERCARVLALGARMTVVLPDYRLAPEHPYPAGLRDVVATLRALSAGTVENVAPGPLQVSGDSAGANLALAAMLHEQREERPLPNSGLLFYGNYTTDLSGEAYVRFAEGPGLTTARMGRYWSWYAGGRTLSGDPLACPLDAEDAALGALPPLYLMAAGVDPLFGDTARLAARLAALGRDDRFDIVPGVVHGFLQYTRDLTAARAALAAAGRAARGFVA